MQQIPYYFARVVFHLTVGLAADEHDIKKKVHDMQGLIEPLKAIDIKIKIPW